MLTHHNPSWPIFLFTDASDFAISRIPHQQDDSGKLHPLAYYSRKLSESEVNYSIHDKEMLGVMESFREFRPWLAGTEIPVSVITDHKNLEYFMTLQCLNHRQARWSLELSEYNFKLSHVPGKENPADAPSHQLDFVPTDGDTRKEVNMQMLLSPDHAERLWSHPKTIISAPTTAAPAEVSGFSISSDDWSYELSKDDTWREAIQSKMKDWSLVNRIPFFQDKSYVPPGLRNRVLFKHHDSMLAGHPGHAKTISLVSRDYNWPHFSRDVHHYVRSCDICQ